MTAAAAHSRYAQASAISRAGAYARKYNFGPEWGIPDSIRFLPFEVVQKKAIKALLWIKGHPRPEYFSRKTPPEKLDAFLASLTPEPQAPEPQALELQAPEPEQPMSLDVTNAQELPIGDPSVKEVFRWWRSTSYKASGLKLIHWGTELCDLVKDKQQAFLELREHGFEKGTPDLILIAPRIFGFNKCVGAAIEIKKHGDTLRPEQSTMLAEYGQLGFQTCVANGPDHAIALLQQYLGGASQC